MDAPVYVIHLSSNQLPAALGVVSERGYNFEIGCWTTETGHGLGLVIRHDIEYWVMAYNRSTLVEKELIDRAIPDMFSTSFVHSRIPEGNKFKHGGVALTRY
mmetsp:Transcript_20632/g.57261  ORF Transcript_20632/g.57261 Transcript_20632/m.57261 type:complete len:102 (+) Transcript_20632:875-1180(+)